MLKVTQTLRRRLQPRLPGPRVSRCRQLSLGLEGRNLTDGSSEAMQNQWVEERLVALLPNAGRVDTVFLGEGA